MNATVRPVNLQDVPAITDIYNEYVLHSTATFETEPLAVPAMRERVSAISSAFPYLVCEVDGVLAGYCYAHPWQERAAYRHTWEVSVYLSIRHTGRGLGRLLLEPLMDACRAARCHALIACITAENESSRAFHRRLGFEQVAHYRQVGWKFGRWLDVVDYELVL